MMTRKKVKNATELLKNCDICKTIHGYGPCPVAMQQPVSSGKSATVKVM
jgi:hypothetical protein